MIQQQHDADWARIRTEPRPVTRDIVAQGVGMPRLQLIVCPSFEASRVWDVRCLPQADQPDEWRLYRSQVVEPWPELRLMGYERIPFDSRHLEAFFRRLVSLTLPVMPDLSGYGGLDGTLYQVAAFGDRYSAWRFQWWSSSPTHWHPLVKIASEMIEAFKATE